MLYSYMEPLGLRTRANDKQHSGLRCGDFVVLMRSCETRKCDSTDMYEEFTTNFRWVEPPNSINIIFGME